MTRAPLTRRRIALWTAATVLAALIVVFAVNLYWKLSAPDPDTDPGIIFERQNRPRYG